MSNPFAPPESDGSSARYSSAIGADLRGPWREGTQVICAAASDHPWPARCVKCGAPSQLPARRQPLSWTPRWVFFVFLVIRLIGIILYFMLRKRGHAMIYLCERHESQRNLGKWVAGVSAVVLLSSIFFAAATEVFEVFILSAIAFFPMIIGLVVQQSVRPAGADKVSFRIDGVHSDVLDVLPRWPGALP